MNVSSTIRTLRPLLARAPALKRVLHHADDRVTRWKHRLAERVPALVRPAPRQLTVAITAACNFRCIGCRYGRDFMVGDRLPLDLTLRMLDDAAEAGVNRVRFYGGEPLLHPDLAAMIRRAKELGMDSYITTNALLLDKKIDELYEAGLRWLTMGFYGIGDEMDAYTQREGNYANLRASLDSVHERYAGRIEMQLNWVVIRPTCDVESLSLAWKFATDYDMAFHLDLYGYSIPFFTDGPQNELVFEDSDRPAIDAVVTELIRLKELEPERFPQAVPFLRSVPDWLLLGADMRVPCDAYQLLWIGADGGVQLCDTAFPLGNLHEQRLRDIIGTKKHAEASRDGFALKCPNCTCKCDSRIMKHAASLAKYS